jgi:hypothetical protein
MAYSNWQTSLDFCDARAMAEMGQNEPPIFMTGGDRCSPETGHDDPRSLTLNGTVPLLLAREDVVFL